MSLNIDIPTKQETKIDPLPSLEFFLKNVDKRSIVVNTIFFILDVFIRKNSCGHKDYQP